MDGKTIARTGEPVRAVVYAGGEETPYLRAGRGDALVLLIDEYDGPLALELIAVLSAKFLVIAPRMPQKEGEEAPGPWLANVIEGLGLARASILTQTGFMTDSGAVMRQVSADTDCAATSRG